MFVHEGNGRLSGPQLSEISNAVVGIHRRYYGRGATKARTYQVSHDLVMVELRDAYLAIERTLIERGRASSVREMRLTFQQTMQQEFVAALEHITGRNVCSYTSESITSPAAILEIFYLEPTATACHAVSEDGPHHSV